MLAGIRAAQLYNACDAAAVEQRSEQQVPLAEQPVVRGSRCVRVVKEAEVHGLREQPFVELLCCRQRQGAAPACERRTAIGRSH